METSGRHSDCCDLYVDCKAASVCSGTAEGRAIAPGFGKLCMAED